MELVKWILVCGCFAILLPFYMVGFIVGTIAEGVMIGFISAIKFFEWVGEL